MKPSASIPHSHVPNTPPKPPQPLHTTHQPPKQYSSTVGAGFLPSSGREGPLRLQRRCTGLEPPFQNHSPLPFPSPNKPSVFAQPHECTIRTGCLTAALPIAQTTERQSSASSADICWEIVCLSGLRWAQLIQGRPPTPRTNDKTIGWIEGTCGAEGGWTGVIYLTHTTKIACILNCKIG